MAEDSLLWPGHSPLAIAGVLMRDTRARRLQGLRRRRKILRICARSPIP